MSWDGSRLGEPETVLTGIPKGGIHNGGRMAIGPDGFLYVGTGETGDTSLAQDLDSLGGKILRLTLDGRPAPGNPFDSAVWSYGHRNVQGLAFDGEGRLWASEFGQNTWDELNLITKGADYGWPRVEGSGNVEGMTDPVVVWRTGDASPSGLAFWRGELWMASLRGARLWEIPVTGAEAGEPVAHFTRRLRAAALGGADRRRQRAAGHHEQHRRPRPAARRRRPDPARHPVTPARRPGAPASPTTPPITGHQQQLPSACRCCLRPVSGR